MTQEQIGKALLQLFAQSSFPGAAIDQAMEIRDFLSGLESGEVVVVRRQGTDQVTTSPSPHGGAAT